MTTQLIIALDDPHFVNDPLLVGGKASGLRFLIERDIDHTLPGFVLTTQVFTQSVLGGHSDQIDEIDNALAAGDAELAQQLAELLSTQIKNMSFNATTGYQLNQQIARLVKSHDCRSFAVRSSCTQEDGTLNSFAGVFNSFLNVSASEVAQSIFECYASLYTKHSLAYAQSNNVQLSQLRMAVVVQIAINSTTSGVAFSRDPRTSDNNVTIEAVPGLGEGLVSGRLIPDRYLICKHKLSAVSRQLRNAHLGKIAFCEGQSGIELQNTDEIDDSSFCLDWNQACQIARTVSRLEQEMRHPVDVEWLIGPGQSLYFVQVRPLTRVDTSDVLERQSIQVDSACEAIACGQPITDRVVHGKVRWARYGDAPAVTGEVIVADTIDVDWLPQLLNASAVVAGDGGYTSHIAIILREHGIPALFSAGAAIRQLANRDPITVDCNGGTGCVYRDHLPINTETTGISDIYRPKTKVHAVTSSLDGLAQTLRLPLSGIGLVRMEFLIAKHVGVHPLAIRDFDCGALDDQELKFTIAEATRGYPSASDWYVETLANAICEFAAMCPEQTVNVRFPDLLSDDYLTLVGGALYEDSQEANPMLGWRGTTKLISQAHIDAFMFDCRALRMVVEERGFGNVNMLLPFCRLPADAIEALRTIRQFGPRTARVGMMVEIPVNVVLADRFVNCFDFFLVGPMDLTQLTYAADRKSTKLGRYNNETEATKEMVKIFLERIKGKGKDVYIGGWPLFQHYPEYRELSSNNRLMLVELPDRMVELFQNLETMERELDAHSQFAQQVIVEKRSSEEGTHAHII